VKFREWHDTKQRTVIMFLGVFPKLAVLLHFIFVSMGTVQVTPLRRTLASSP